MRTQTIKLADIKPAEYNPRVTLTEKDQEYKALAASIEDNGLVLPLVVNLRDGVLISGHQRLNVLLASGETETEAVVVDMDPAQAKALCIAMNKLDGEWDNGSLADLLRSSRTKALTSWAPASPARRSTSCWETSGALETMMTRPPRTRRRTTRRASSASSATTPSV